MCLNQSMDITAHPPATVIIPAHNEERSIARLVDALTTPLCPELEIMIVCNGCTDNTAEVAAARSDHVRVVEIAVASKQAALAAGNAAAAHPARVYCDADVVITGRSVRNLVAALRAPVQATAPEREMDFQRSGWVVRRYYRVWLNLPQVRSSLFGRGVIALSAAGLDRVQALPRVMSDDLALSEAFAPTERLIVSDAQVTVAPPRSVADLLRRRTRAAIGIAEVDRLGLRGAQARTGMGTLTAIARTSPAAAVDVATFVGVTVVARMTAAQRRRRGTAGVWLRDESSRAG